MATAYGYARVIRLGTIPRKIDKKSQISAITHYTEKLRMLDPTIVVGKIFCDSVYRKSCEKMHALPAAKKMLNEAKPGDLIIIASISRAFYAPADALKFYVLCRERGLKLHFAEHGLAVPARSPTGLICIRLLRILADGQEENWREHQRRKEWKNDHRKRHRVTDKDYWKGGRREFMTKQAKLKRDESP